jgi:hypothetical protein
MRLSRHISSYITKHNYFITTYNSTTPDVLPFLRLDFWKISAILVDASLLAMTINALRNRRYGPGGGTRRLHHSLLKFKVFVVTFPVWGRNRIDVRSKGGCFRSAWYHRYRAKNYKC